MSVISIVTKPDGSRAAPPLAEPRRLELARDEADRHDAEPLGRLQQPLAGELPGGVVLEIDLPEPRQSVADMGGVVDRQAAPALRVDVRKGPVRKAGTFVRLQASHG